jgi:hypothetical protein
VLPTEWRTNKAGVAFTTPADLIGGAIGYRALLVLLARQTPSLLANPKLVPPAGLEPAPHGLRDRHLAR